MQNRFRNFQRGKVFRRTRTWPSALRFPAARKPWEFPGAWVPWVAEFFSEVNNHYKGACGGRQLEWKKGRVSFGRHVNPPLDFTICLVCCPCWKKYIVFRGE